MPDQQPKDLLTTQHSSTGNDYICTSSMPSTAAPTTSRDGECWLNSQSAAI